MICCTNAPINKIFYPYRESSHYFPYSIKKESPSILDSLPSSPRSLRAIDQEGYISQVKEQYCPLRVRAHATLYLEGIAREARAQYPGRASSPVFPHHLRLRLRRLRRTIGSPKIVLPSPYSPLDGGGGGSFFAFTGCQVFSRREKKYVYSLSGLATGYFSSSLRGLRRQSPPGHALKLSVNSPKPIPYISVHTVRSGNVCLSPLSPFEPPI